MNQKQVSHKSCAQNLSIVKDVFMVISILFNYSFFPFKLSLSETWMCKKFLLHLKKTLPLIHQQKLIAFTFSSIRVTFCNSINNSHCALIIALFIPHGLYFLFKCKNRLSNVVIMQQYVFILESGENKLCAFDGMTWIIDEFNSSTLFCYWTIK